MRILVIEDDTKMASMLKEGLERDGYRITLAPTGQDGLELASDYEFEAIILDRMLPEMDGISVAKHLRQRDVVTPILMLTARDAVADIVSGLDSGVDDYLTKPFSFAVLSARLRAIRRRSPMSIAHTLHYDDLVLDPASHRATRAGKELQLTRTEFLLLQHLMERPEKIFRREALIDAVWRYEETVESNTLDAFIKQLRSKVDFEGTPKLIQTVRGFGFRLAKEQP